MATVTALGFSIFSRFDGSGVERANRALNRLQRNLNSSSKGLNTFTGRMGTAILSISTLGPALLPVTNVLAGMSAGLVAVGGAAALGAGVFARAMRDSIEMTNGLAAAHKHLTPAQQNFIRLEKESKKVTTAVTKSFMNQKLMVASDLLSAYNHALPQINTLVGAFFPPIKRASQAIQDWVDRSNGLNRALSNIKKFGVPALDGFIRIGRNLLSVLGTGWRAVLPLGNSVVKTLVRGSAALRQWSDNGGFTRWVASVRKDGPAVRQFFQALWGAVKNLSRTVGGLSGGALRLATDLARMVAAAPPATIRAIGNAFLLWKSPLGFLIANSPSLRNLLGKILGNLTPKEVYAIAAALLILKNRVFLLGTVLPKAVKAMRGLAKAIALLQGGASLKSVFIGMVGKGGVIGLVALAIVGLVVAFIFLWKKCEWFRNFWKGLWRGLKAIASGWWQLIMAEWHFVARVWRAVWSGMKAVGKAIWGAIRRAAVSIFTNTRDRIVGIWKTITRILSVVWNGLKRAGSAAWGWMRRTAVSIFNNTRSRLAAIWRGISHVASVVWGGMKRAGSAAWGWMRKTAVSIFNNTKSRLGSIWHGTKNIASKVWSGMKSAGSTAWGWMRRTAISVFNNMKNRLGSIWNGIKRAASAAWNALRKIVGVPVKFVINTVIGGLAKTFNSIAKAVHLGLRVPVPHVNFAAGGHVRGPGGGRDDRVPAMLSNGEYVIPAKVVREKGVGFFDALRKGTDPMRTENHGFSGGGKGGIPGMLLGGIIPNPIDIIKDVAGGIGNVIGGVLNFAKKIPGVGLLMDVFGTLTKKAVGLLFKVVTGTLGRIPGAGVMVKLGSSMAKKLIDGAIDLVFKKNQESFANLGGHIPAGKHKAIILAALRAAHVPPPGSLAQWLTGMNTLITRESGWNAGAVNRTDSNAAAGHASRGLAQTIPSTFNAYVPAALRHLGINNPVANVAAAIRYIVARYGNITKVQQANAHLPPKGYAMGGLVAGSYDKGGYLPPGWSLAHNGTGRPEPVGGSGTIVFEDCTFVGSSRREWMDLFVKAHKEAERKKRI